ncbi:MAG: adenylyltransferase/cytidyltransferase family protein [Candidatus Micrarchaeota archaeon]
MPSTIKAMLVVCFIVKRVLVCGCFDLFHPGHLFFFKQAREYGDYLIVLVARDSNALKIKGEKPLNNEFKRKQRIEEMSVADEVVLGDEFDLFKGALRHYPDVIVLGYDQVVDVRELRKVIKERKLNIRVIRLKKPLNPTVFKSSILRKNVFR